MSFDELGERSQDGEPVFENKREGSDQGAPKQELAKADQPVKGGPGPGAQVTGLGPGEKVTAEQEQRQLNSRTGQHQVHYFAERVQKVDAAPGDLQGAELEFLQADRRRQ